MMMMMIKVAYICDCVCVTVLRCHGWRRGIRVSLENLAIANALQLESARTTPAFSFLNYDATPSLKSLNLSIAVYYSVLLLIHYCTL